MCLPSLSHHFAADSNDIVVANSPRFVVVDGVFFKSITPGHFAHSTSLLTIQAPVDYVQSHYYTFLKTSLPQEKILIYLRGSMSDAPRIGG